MKCPACDKTLHEIEAGEVKVDLCDTGCGGVWFDDRELKKFDEEHEFHAETVLQATEAATDKPAPKTVRDCPKCPGEVLWRRWYDPKNEVEVDQCPKCSGIWLDAGELKAIRAQFSTEEERVASANAWLDTNLDTAKKGTAIGYREEALKDRQAVKDGAAKTLYGDIKEDAGDVRELLGLVFKSFMR